MRVRRVLPSVLLLTLGLVAPATAADVGVQAVDYAFMPRALKIAPGDSVSWTFSGDAEHTSTSVRGQAESWSSGLEGSGATYSHTFTKPGRFQYICLPHRFTMKGTIQVGDDSVPRSIKGGKTVVRGTKATTRFRLLEPARVSGVLKGPKKVRVELESASAGPVRLDWKTKLKPGRYRGQITAVDDFDKRTVKKVGFEIATARSK